MNLLESVNILGDIITGSESTNRNIHNKNIEEANIYNSNKLKKSNDSLRKRAKKGIDQSRDPIRTGVINKNVRNRGSNKKSILKKEYFGNVDSEFSDTSSIASKESVISISNDPNLLINQSQKVFDNRLHERKFQNKNHEDSFLNQYEPMKYDMGGAPSSSNAVHGSDSGTSRLQAERNLALNGGYSNFEGSDMTYGMVPKDEFTFSNMVPYFKSATYGSDVRYNKKRNDISQRKMETFTGILPDKIPKTEQKPLFSPLLGITNIHGMPSITNLIEDRYVPGRERKNELPFKQERVTPGLNLGYNEINKNGDNFRVLPKTIDELRTLNNQQKTYSVPVVDGMKGTRGPVIGTVKKYKPERTKYLGDERMLPSLGDIRGPAIYGEVNKGNLATINRGLTDKTTLGPAQSEVQQAIPENQREKYKNNFKQNYKQAEPRNIMLVEGLRAREDSKNYVLDPTQRGKSQDYLGAIGTSQITKGNSFDMITNILDPTKRNLTKGTDRAGAAIGTSENNKSKTINYDDIMDPTMRDIYSKTDRNGVVAGDRGGNYTINYTNATPELTMREVHSKTDRNGVVAGDRGGNYVVNYINATPDPTMREIHSKTDRNGVVAGDRGGNYVVNYTNATPELTMREIHSKTDRNGVVAGDRGGNYTINYIDYTPDPTMREIHSKTDRNGVVVGDRGGNYTINYIDYTPDQTMREIHSKLGRSAAGASGVYLATRTRDDANNSIVNIQREVIAKGRAPTNSNYNKGPTIDFTAVSLCEPIQIRRDLMSSTIAINDKLPFTLTQTPTGRTVSNTRINEFTQSALDKNPYINNIVHKSVEY